MAGELNRAWLRELAQTQVLAGKLGMNTSGLFYEQATPQVFIELLDALEEAEQERDAMRAELGTISDRVAGVVEELAEWKRRLGFGA